VDAKDIEDNNFIRTVKRQKIDEDYKSKILKLRDFELFLYENTRFPQGYAPTIQFENEINNIREKFYSSDSKVDIDVEIINEMKQEEVENYMYIEEALKSRKTDEVTFNQIIEDLGYEDDFFKRIRCLERGCSMKIKKGHKKIAKKGKKPEFLYTYEDVEDMKKIVTEVYSQP
jgi:hypothetical protein